MEISKEEITIKGNTIEATIFKNYGDQLLRHGVAPIFEDFWGYVTIKKNDNTPLMGFPISDDKGTIKTFKNYSDAVDAAREILKSYLQNK